MKIEYKIQDRFDFGLFIPALLLGIIGLVAIYSSTLNHPTMSGNFDKQAFWLVVSLAAFFVIYFLPQPTFKWSAILLYVVGLLLLIVVLVAGKKVYGARSWISFGSVGFQPSEFMKMGMIFLMAFWLSMRNRNVDRVYDIAIALAIGAFPIMLILLQPDMGTSIVYMLIVLSMIFWGGISLFTLFVVISPGVVIFASLFGMIPFISTLLLVGVALFFFKRHIFTSASVFVLNLAAGFFFEYIFTLLQPHQQRRIETFLKPDSDPLGSGYNALQAKVAIGSGGLWGKGFLEGNQTQLRFIPEQWTDFIYCVIGEEFGFFGSVLTLALFLIIFIRLFNLSFKAKDNFSSLVVIGILTLLFVHFAINIGMNLGITPVIGLPLPFVSYGGTSLLLNFSLLGVAANIYKNRIQTT
ncbi:MAG: rod shape-determining protein RodA [Melioribacteraceae bacterium]|nr:MAG: rod shape-determining protein RodA [Melioribacteraceae bacterium]